MPSSNLIGHEVAGHAPSCVGSGGSRIIHPHYGHGTSRACGNLRHDLHGRSPRVGCGSPSLSSEHELDQVRVQGRWNACHEYRIRDHGVGLHDSRCKNDALADDR